MFRVTEYIAKSFKVTENGIIRKLAYGFLFTLRNALYKFKTYLLTQQLRPYL